MTGEAEYARALFLITEEDGVTDQVAADVETLKRVFESNPDYAKLLDTPALDKAQRLAIVSEALGSMDWRVSNLMKLLTEKHLSHLTVRMAKEYLGLVDEARGILRVDAITAVAMTEEQKRALSARLGATTGKTAVGNNTVDEGIIGGMKLRYAGVQLDGSIKTKLEKFEDGLKTLVL